MKKLYNDPGTYVHDKSKEIVISEPSLAIPGQALSLSDLLYKHTRGIAPSVMKEAIYEDEPDDYDDINPLYESGVDISDIVGSIERANDYVEKAIKLKNDKKSDELKKALAELEVLRKQTSNLKGKKRSEEIRENEEE